MPCEFSGLGYASFCGHIAGYVQRFSQKTAASGSPVTIQKIPGSNIRGFLIICARYWVRTSEGKNFPSARGTNKSFPRRGHQPEEVTGSPPGTQKIPGSNIRGFHTCARYWVRTSEGKNFPSARGTNKSFPRRGRQPEEVTGSSLGTQKIPGPSIRGFLIICARYWVRTSDLFGVNEARYHCANRAHR